MSAIYLGSFSVGGSVPGLSACFANTLGALDDLKSVVNTEMPNLLTGSSTISGQVTALAAIAAALLIKVPGLGSIGSSISASVGDLGSLSADLEAAVIPELQAKLNAAVNLQAGFVSMPDPAAYLAGLLSALAGLQIDLSATPPSAAVSVQASASAKLSTDLGTKLSALQANFSAMANVGLDLSGSSVGLGSLSSELAALSASVTLAYQALSLLVGSLGAIKLALDAAVSAALDDLEAAEDMAATLAIPGAHCFIYDGALSGLGAALDAATGGTGLGGATQVRVPIILVDKSSAPSLDSVNAVFRTQ